MEQPTVSNLPAPQLSTRSPHHTTPINYSALTPYTPYITQWSAEQKPSCQLIERLGRGIGYLDETLYDRDDHGVLWDRTPHRPGTGQPMFAVVHPLRQRRAMHRLLCNVCAGPADQTDDGTLWLVRDYRNDWPGWPNRMGVTEPPVCAPCVRVATRLCPSLRKGAVAIRARHKPIVGVRGLLYRSNGRTPVAIGHETITYGDPRVRWIQARYLIRELLDCDLVPLEQVCRSSIAT